MTAKRFKLSYPNGAFLIDGDKPLCSIENDLMIVDLLNELAEENKELKKENEQLKTKNNAYIQDIEVFKEENTHLKLENEQLQARNDRQAKRLAELYELMAKKDWESLTAIIDDFKRCEEQLQRESGTYW